MYSLKTTTKNKLKMLPQYNPKHIFVLAAETNADIASLSILALSYCVLNSAPRDIREASSLNQK